MIYDVMLYPNGISTMTVLSTLHVAGDLNHPFTLYGVMGLVRDLAFLCLDLL